MGFVLPTLQRLDGVKIAIELWNDVAIQYDIKLLLAERKYPLDFVETEDVPDKWQHWQVEVEDKVLKKVSYLSLPESLKKYVLSYVRPIGLEILKWWHYHNVVNKDLALNLIEELRWTCQGTVDYKKTAEMLVKDEEMDVEKRYLFACVYCLDDEIRDLWKLIPEERKIRFYNNDSVMRSYCKDLVLFWTFTINGAVVLLDNLFRKRGTNSPNQFAFRCAVNIFSVPACKYFFEKLSREEKDEVLEGEYMVDTLRSRDVLPSSVDVVCFLLSQMSDEQQERLFQRHFAGVLQCLLVWPFQPLFTELVKRDWHSMSEDCHYELLRLITRKIHRGYKDYDYKEVFREMWRNSSDNLKNIFVAEEPGLIMANLFQAKEEELVRWILSQASASQKEQLFYCASAYVPVDQEEWDFLYFLMDECFVSKEMIVTFKKNLSSYLARQGAQMRLKYDKYFQLLNDFVEDKKRKRLDKDLLLI